MSSHLTRGGWSSFLRFLSPWAYPSLYKKWWRKPRKGQVGSIASIRICGSSIASKQKACTYLELSTRFPLLHLSHQSRRLSWCSPCLKRSKLSSQSGLHLLSASTQSACLLLAWSWLSCSWSWSRPHCTSMSGHAFAVLRPQLDYACGVHEDWTRYQWGSLLHTKPATLRGRTFRKTRESPCRSWWN